MPFPVLRINRVWHVGTMNPQHKGTGSYEGNGLSVSSEPRAWVRIAKLGGAPTWRLTKRGGRFLDYLEMSDEDWQEIIRWAIGQGLVEEIPVYSVTTYDDEWETDLTSDFESLEDAEAEDGDVSEKIGYRPTEALAARMRGDRRVGSGQSYMATAYAEDVLGLDGVWWDEMLEPDRLSAPRGVIFSKKVPEWTATLEDRNVGSWEG